MVIPHTGRLVQDFTEPGDVVGAYYHLFPHALGAPLFIVVYHLFPHALGGPLFIIVYVWYLRFSRFPQSRTGAFTVFENRCATGKSPLVLWIVAGANPVFVCKASRLVLVLRFSQ